MRPIAALIAAFVLCPFAAQAACTTAKGSKEPHVRWEVDRYIYDAPLHRDWEVLVDCDYPNAPPHIELSRSEEMKSIRGDTGLTQGASQENGKLNTVQGAIAPASVKAGEIVEISTGASAPVRISMQGVAIQTGFMGQKIRIRLSTNGKFVTGIVRGPHSAELAIASQASWRQP